MADLAGQPHFTRFFILQHKRTPPWQYPFGESGRPGPAWRCAGVLPKLDKLVPLLFFDNSVWAGKSRVICIEEFRHVRFFVSFCADALLIDGSLECKFLAYFGTMLTVLLPGGIAPYNAPKDPLLKGVHVHMSSPLHCALTIPARGRNVKILLWQLFLMLLLFQLPFNGDLGSKHHSPHAGPFGPPH